MSAHKRQKATSVTDRFKLEPLSARVLFSADVQWLTGVHGLSAIDDAELGYLTASSAPLIQLASNDVQRAANQDTAAEQTRIALKKEIVVTIGNDSDVATTAEEWLRGISEELATHQSVDVLNLPVNAQGNLVMSNGIEITPVEVLVNAQTISSWQSYLSDSARIVTYTVDDSLSPVSIDRTIDGLSASERSLQTLTGTNLVVGNALPVEPVSNDFSPTLRNGSAAIYTVTTLADSGTGSFREALDLAINDNDPAPALIRFDVSGTIDLQSRLPVISGSIYIDAYDGSGINTGPRITLDGSNSGVADILSFDSANDSFLQGIGVINSGNDAVQISNSDGVVIKNNYLGNDGDSVFSNDRIGVHVVDSRNITIEGNVISGNGTDGIRVTGISDGFEDNIRIYSNIIGLDESGENVLGNGDDGIKITDVVNVHIGLNEALGNYISGHGGNAIDVRNTFDNIVIGGNVIGVTSDGQVASNTLENIFIIASGSDLTIGFDSLLGSDGNTISNSGEDGIQIIPTTGEIGFLKITGNNIGTDVSGNVSMGNGDYGIFINNNVTNVIIGEAVVGGGNVISGNDNNGIRLFGNNISNVQIDNNIIGLSADGSIVMGNASHGIYFIRTSGFDANGVLASYSIGTNDSANAHTGNLIAGNSTSDVRVLGVVGAKIFNNTFGLFADGREVFTSDNAIQLSNDVSGFVIGEGGSGNTFGRYIEAIEVRSSSTAGGVISNNVFGRTNFGSGIPLLNNVYGVSLEFSTSDVFVGYNRFYYMEGAAVFTTSSSNRNTIIGNIYHGNTGLYTDLSPVGPNNNDPDDRDTGANGKLNYPDIISAEQIDADTLQITASIDTERNKTFRVDAYLLEESFGQGTSHLSAATYSVGGSGDTTFTMTIDSNLLREGEVALTLTEDTGAGGLTNSSEFSPAFAIDVPLEFQKNDISPIRDIDSNVNQVDENSPAGSLVGITVNATDLNPNDTVTYSLSNDAGGAFAIDSTTGVISTLVSIDAEIDNEHDIIAVATSSDGSFSTQRLFIIINDVNDTAPEIIPQSIDVFESAEGTFANIALIEATDVEGAFNLQDWTILGNQSDFSIDPDTGLLSLTSSSSLDAANTPQIVLNVTVSDGVNVSIPTAITINVIAANHVTIPVDADTAINTVSSNAVASTPVGFTAFAEDLDVSDSVTYALTDDANGRFTINATTGVVSTANLSPADAGTDQFFTVEATSLDGSTSQLTDVVQITGPIDALSDADSSANTITENSPIGSNTGVTGQASDPDASDTVTYSLLNNAAGRFEIDADTGVLTTLASFDAETDSSLNVTVVAQSTDGTTSTQSFTIAVADVNEFTPQIAGQTLSISESTAPGSLITQLQAVDNDAGFVAQQWAIVSGNTGNAFQIDPATGNLSVAQNASLDAETLQQYNLLVTVSDGSNVSLPAPVTINLIDENEHSVTFPIDIDASNNTVSSLAPIGTSIGFTAFAEDDDLSDGVSYSLTDDANGRLTIDSVTGEIATASSLVADAGSGHLFTVTARSTDGSLSIHTNIVSITGAISPVVDIDATVDEVFEGSPIGTAIGITLEAIDPDNIDSVTYSLSDDAAGRFAVDADTGVITTLASFDAETNNSFNVTTVAHSTDGTTSEQNFTIVVGDVNEFPPQITAQTLSISESTAPGSLITPIQAIDNDVSFDAQQWAIVSGNTGNAFQIDPATGNLSVAPNASLDAETLQQYNLLVTVSDGSNVSLPAPVTINLIDENEYSVSASVDLDSLPNSVASNVPIGTSVGITAFAEDKDLSDGVSYSLSDDANGRFTIDSTTGVISTASSLVADVGSSQRVVVQAISSDGSVSLIADSIFITGPINSAMDIDVTTDEVFESSPIGTSVGITVEAIDPDNIDTVIYSLSDDAAGRFTIDANTGVITTLATFDAETETSFNITAVAQSTDGTTSEQNFTIAIADVNEFTPQITGQTLSISESTAPGSLLNQMQAVDNDASFVAQQWAIVSGNTGNAFQIDPATGNLSVSPSASLDAETLQQYNLLVTVSDGSNVSLPAPVTINLIDENEHSVTTPIDTDASINSVSSLASIGTSIGFTAFAEDQDLSDGVSYSLSNDANGRLTIDSVTGEITTALSLVTDAGSGHIFTVNATSTDGSVSLNTNIVSITGAVGPVADIDSTTDEVFEGSPIGTPVGITLGAVDPDNIDSVFYSLSEDADGRFGIFAFSGVITTLTSFDAETETSFDITAVAQSTDGTTSTQSFTIAVADVNEFTPQITGQTLPISESTAPGSTITQLQAVDNDASFVAQQWAIVSGNTGNAFQIDPATGNLSITQNASLDAENLQQYNLLVTVSDGSNVSLPAPVIINLIDENEHSVTTPVDIDASPNSVASSAPIGTSIGFTAFAEDDDLSDGISYSLSDDANGRFTIDALTGEITTASSLVTDAGSSHQFTVEAISTDGSVSDFTDTVFITGPISSVVDIDVTVNEVFEGSPIGSLVGITLEATDPDLTDTVSYSLLDDAAGQFAIDANTGVITTQALFDAETDSSFDVTAVAQSTDGTTSVQNFTIAIADVNEFTPQITGLTLSISETRLPGSFITQLQVVDNDVSFVAQQWTIVSGNTGNAFQIDSVTGILSIAQSANLDVETQQQYNLLVSVSDGSNVSLPAAVIINLVDENEHSVTTPIDRDAAINSVASSAPIGTSIGFTAFAEDNDLSDGVSYSLSNDANGRLTIDPVTGVISIASSLLADAGSGQLFTVEAISTDGSVSMFTDSVSITGPINSVMDINVAADEVFEGSPIGSLVGVTLEATDPDVIDTVTFSLTDDAGGQFAVDPNTGVITTLASFDAESVSSHALTAVAESSDGTSSTLTIIVTVVDDNEHSVTVPIDTNNAINTVASSAAIGTSIGFTAMSEDVDISDSVTYTLSDDADGRFIINSTTGEVSTALSLLSDAGTSAFFIVKATSSDGSSAELTESIVITGTISQLLDIDASDNNVAFNAPIGSSVGLTVAATDPDASDSVTYSLVNAANGRFALDAVTGVVTTTASLISDEGSMQTLLVQATSTDGTSIVAPFTIAITGPIESIVDADSTINAIDEELPSGSLVGITVQAQDPDSTDTVSYSLIDDANGQFAIDTNTGVVTTTTPLSAEEAIEWQIIASATSSDGTSDSQTFLISVLDTNEFSVSSPIDANPATNQVAATAPVGTTVGLSIVSDDADLSDSVSFSLTDDAAGRFQIEASTGQITTASSLNADAGTDQIIEVQALSSDGSAQIKEFIVHVTGELLPVQDIDLQTNSVSESAAVGSTVGIIVQAIDPDETDSVSYSISDPAQSPFMVDSDTGVVTTNAVLDYESETVHQFTITALSSDGSRETQEFIVNVTDANEYQPLIQTPSLNIAENTQNINLVMLSASDNDGSGTITDWQIESGNIGNAFNLDSETGMLSVSPDANINFEDTAEYSLVVSVSDGTMRSEPTLINILVENVNEAPVFEGAEFETTTDFIGQIGQLEVLDPDTGDTHQFTIQSALESDVSLSANGRLIQNEFLEAGTLQIPVQVVDASGETSSGVISLSIMEAAPELAAALPAINTSLQPLDEVETNPVEEIVASAAREPGFIEATVEPEATSTTNSLSTSEPEQNFETTSSDASLYGAVDESSLTDNLLSEDNFLEPSIFEDSRSFLDEIARQEALDLRLSANNNDSLTGLVGGDLGSNRRLVMNLLVSSANESSTEINKIDTFFVNDYVGSSFSPGFIKALQGVNEDMAAEAARDQQREEFTVSSTTFVSGVLTFGFVTWLLQSGSLLATAATTAPLWQSLDPVPVLVNSDTDSDL